MNTARPPTGLLCALLADPARTVIAQPQPRFGWIVNDHATDARQTAYQIRLTGGGTVIWDTDKIVSAASTAVPYAGPPLAPDQAYAWQVRTWNAAQDASDWSAIQTFRTAARLDPAGFARYPIEQTEVAPQTILRKRDGIVFLDFGRAAFATLRVTLDAHRDGDVVTVHAGEKLAAPQTVDRQPYGSVRYRCATLALRRGRHPYTVAIPPDSRNTGPRAIAMPPDIGEVLPFRYVELEGVPAMPAPGDVRQVAAHYPFDERAAHFACDQDVLNAVWELCRYSVKATSFCGVYVDGDRERIPYTADAYLNQLSHYAVDREFTLARYSTAYCLLHPTWPTEWILHAPLMAWADYLHTGDPDLAARHYDALAAATLTDLARADGLISTRTGLVTPALLARLNMQDAPRPLEDIVDWPPAEFTDGGRGERDDYDMVPVNTVVNAFHHHALVLMGRLADALGRDQDAVHWRAQAGRVAAAFQRVCFDPARGIYRDGEGSAHAALHANLFPLAFGLVPRHLRDGVVAFLKSRGMACSVYGAQYLLEALYLAGEADHALALLTATDDRSWWNMVRVGSTMTLEAWDVRYKQNLDWNHAWGAAPANVIPRYLMGVRPLSPGFERVLIQPQLGALRYAELKLPTIRGPIHVCVTNAPDRLVLEVDLPANMTARVMLPAARATNLRADGQARQGTLEDGFVVAGDLGSGHHGVELQRRGADHGGT